MAQAADDQTPFAKALALKHERDGVFTTVFPSSFCFGKRAHGGLLVSLIQRAAAMHLEQSPDRPNQPDVQELKVHFFRPSVAEEVTIHVQDVSLGRQLSTLEVKLWQRSTLNMSGLITMVNFEHQKGPSFDTHWSLSPSPAEASISLLALDADPRWISYQCPWHPQGYRRPQSYVKFFVPLQFRDPSYRDCWLTPSDPSFAFKNEHLGFVGDMTLPIIDNFCGEDGVGSHAACVAAGLKQKQEREKCITPAADDEIGSSFATPIVSVTLSLNMEIKKNLPAEGTRWLFSRSRARQISDGKMDNEIIILDEGGQIVAIIQQVHQLFEIAKGRSSDAKL